MGNDFMGHCKDYRVCFGAVSPAGVADHAALAGVVALLGLGGGSCARVAGPPILEQIANQISFVTDNISLIGDIERVFRQRSGLRLISSRGIHVALWPSNFLPLGYCCTCARRLYWRYSWSCFDLSGGRISNASIAFVNNATGFRYITTSDAEGRFALDLLPPGEYSGSVEAQGMSPQVAEPLQVEAGGALQVEFKLLAGPAAVSAVGDERTVRSNK